MSNPTLEGFAQICLNLGHLLTIEDNPSSLQTLIRHQEGMNPPEVFTVSYLVAIDNQMLKEIFLRFHTNNKPVTQLTAVIAGTHAEFEHYCLTNKINPRDPHSGYVYILEPNSARGRTFTKLVEYGTYLDRLDYKQCRDSVLMAMRTGIEPSPLFIPTIKPENLETYLKQMNIEL